MGRSRNYQAGLYEEFEKLNKKLDKLLLENKKQSITIYNLNLDIDKLTKELEKANELNEKLQKENERLKNQINKNSTNSSKPSSTDMNKPKKSGANLYNYRIKTGNKVGGQYGHPGRNLNKDKIETLIKEEQIIVKEIHHKIKGSSKKEPIVKYRVGIEIIPYIEKHIFEFSEKSEEVLPKEFYTDVTYGNSIKTLSVQLGAYNVISYDRLSDFFSVVTNNVINISNGTLVNFIKEFSIKSQESLSNIENHLLNGKNIKTDETTSKCLGKKGYVRNYSNELNVIYKFHKNKGHEPIKEDNILPRFLGGIMGDHDTALYSYGTKNYECNVHLGRYLEELVQNVPDILWPKKMKELLFRMNSTKKIAKAYGLKRFDISKIREYEKEFEEILKLAKEENKNIKSTFYKDKANKLYRRLKSFKKNHLYFIKDFEVDFDNNMSEQDLRMYKIKNKVSGCFRSKGGAEAYADALSIIKTSIKRGKNPFDSIKSIFNNEVLFTK